jgi:NAD-dependent dihydropyrimidine dehydrogenase PreA subunit
MAKYKDFDKSVFVRKRNCIQHMVCVSSCPTIASEVKKKQLGAHVLTARLAFLIE